MAPPTSSQYAIIAGVGPGTGASVARRFAETYPVILLARNPTNYTSLITEIESNGGQAVGISTDLSCASSVNAAFKEISALNNGNGITLAAAIYNVGGKFVRKPFLDLTLEEFEAGFDVGGRGAFLFAQHTLPLLLAAVPPEPSTSTSSKTHTLTKPSNPPTLIFTGATASLRGSALCSSMAAGKFALRALAQSLGREFGPRGVHVAHVVVDGVIDIERTKAYTFDRPDAKIAPGAIADQYFYLHTQPRTMFTHELDIRPYVEKW